MFFLNQKTADVLGSSDWSSDLCSSDLVIEPESLICTCGGCLHCIGEDVSERLDVVPARFRVIITRRPKYSCRSCGDGVRQAPSPAHLIEGGFPTVATIAPALLSNYAEHLSLYRPAQIYSRQCNGLDRRTEEGPGGKECVGKGRCG